MSNKVEWLSDGFVRVKTENSIEIFKPSMIIAINQPKGCDFCNITLAGDYGACSISCDADFLWKLHNFSHQVLWEAKN